jgi:heat shock protein HtpX
MIHIIPMILMLLPQILVGPPIGPPAQSMLVIVVAFVGLVASVVLRRSFRGRTITLLGILGVMLAQSLFVVASLCTDFLGQSSAYLANGAWSNFSTLRTADLIITVAGIFAAVCTALFVNFRKPRGMSKGLSEVRLLETPAELSMSVSRLASRAGIVCPEVWLIDSGLPFAFTMRAKRRCSVAVSVGLLESLDGKETEACVAHEISHLKNNDFTVRFLATLAKVALFAKPLSYLVEPAVYRAREFLADRTAAELIGGSDALISALSKIEESYSVAAPSIFGPIGVCNLSGRKGFFGVFDKHPDFETRIKMLKEMKRA